MGDQLRPAVSKNKKKAFFDYVSEPICLYTKNGSFPGGLFRGERVRNCKTREFMRWRKTGSQIQTRKRISIIIVTREGNNPERGKKGVGFGRHRG